MASHPTLRLTQHLSKSILTAAATLAFAAIAKSASAAPSAPEPGQTLSVLSYGAVADGKTLNTSAIQSAIDAASSAGGGRVRIPAGTYLTGPIVLRSDVELHADAGATVLFSTDYKDYPLVSVNYEGRDSTMCQSPISGENLHDVSITGPGIFDGQGDVWRPTKKSKLTQAQWDALIKHGGRVDENSQTWYPLPPADEFKADDTRRDPYKVRPPLMYLANSQRILLDQATFSNSPNWNLHLLLSSQITVRNVTLFNPLYAQNGDGMDLDSCRDVLVTQTTINAGDDCLCLKSGRDEAGRLRNRPTENVTITDCRMGWGHGGVVIGSEMSGGVRNINVSNCVFTGTDAGLRFKSAVGRGGTVENITVNNITMSDIHGPAILFDMNYSVGLARGQVPAGPAPEFRDIRISNLNCTSARQAIAFRGLAQLPLENITLDNVRIAADTGATFTYGKNIVLRDVTIQSTAAPALQSENMQGFTLERLSTNVGPRIPATQPTPQPVLQSAAPSR